MGKDRKRRIKAATIAKGEERRARQCAALPIRVTPDGVEVMLVTSRETRRWILPKGWLERGTEPEAMAAREAWEEAGLRGRVRPGVYAEYHYDKRLPSGRLRPCRVDVYLLLVDMVADAWPEQGQRERRWLTPAQAAFACGESGLVPILLGFALPED
ncbi:MAG: hypothetical protein RLY86_10 [Pseudomonadota bacterium]|jgi:8-oxo-dGTP pyrophosphatase MutT (NUDIX family)